jgi:hypothetical protein
MEELKTMYPSTSQIYHDQLVFDFIQAILATNPNLCIGFPPPRKGVLAKKLTRNITIPRLKPLILDASWYFILDASSTANTPLVKKSSSSNKPQNPN